MNANGTTCRHFYYDDSLGYSGSIPTGVTAPTYPKGRMIEAATDACAATPTSSTIITDDWFSYDKDGRATTQWQSTPHSTQYYESTAAFTGPMLTSIQLANPSFYTLTYGLDGEGRWSSMTNSSGGQTIVSGTTFNAASQPSIISIGTSTDNDTYTYDPNTQLMKTWSFEVGATPAYETGTLTWNPNNTLAELQITDGFNSGGTQTCYSNSSGVLGQGYDDLGRLVEFDCGSGNWGQEFSYDQYDNLTKTVPTGRTGVTYDPGYSATTNQVDGASYDANGDMTNNGNGQVFGWTPFSKMAWTAASGTPICGTSGRCATYDAFGRMVESSNNSTYSEYWFTQGGGKIVMSGTSIDDGYLPTPGGGTHEQLDATGGHDYMHKDWLGNSRLQSIVGGQTVVADQAYAPYGEVFNFIQGTGSQLMFTGDLTQLDPEVLWDTPNREFAGSDQGRWLSPDPAGSGWNQYAYATNPNSNVDPTGLAQCSDQQSPAICQGGYYGGTGFFINWTNWDEFEIMSLAYSDSYEAPDPSKPWAVIGDYNGALVVGGCDECINQEIPQMMTVYPNIGLLGLLSLSQAARFLTFSLASGYAPSNPQQPQQPKPEPKPGWCTALNHAGNTTVALGGATFLWGTLADAGVVTAPAGVALQASGGIGMAVGGIGMGIADTGLALGICH